MFRMVKKHGEVRILSKIKVETMSLKVADIKSGLKTLNVRDFKLRHDARSFELFKKVKETGDQYFIDIT